MEEEEEWMVAVAVAAARAAFEMQSKFVCLRSLSPSPLGGKQERKEARAAHKMPDSGDSRGNGDVSGRRGTHEGKSGSSHVRRQRNYEKEGGREGGRDKGKAMGKKDTFHPAWREG